MRIARFSIDGNVAFGAVEEGPDGLLLDIIKGIPYADFELSGTKVPLSKVRLLPPCSPTRSWPSAATTRSTRRSSATRSPRSRSPSSSRPPR
ncbi:DUF2437 domain-containing protein [Streptomyces zhihengii]